MDYKNIMKELLNPSHSPARSGKDLSHRKIFSCKAGQLLPILCEELVPNDYFEIDTASLVRTFPLKTAAFVRAKVHFDFFFVPKTAIWRNWDRFYYQRNDHESSYLNGFAYEPNITLQDVCIECQTSRYTPNVTDWNSPEHRAKIAQLLGYGTFGYCPTTDFQSGGQFAAIKDKSLTILPIMGYHRIYNFWYRNAWRDEPAQEDANMYSADNWNCSSYAGSLFSVNYGSTSSDKPIFQMHYHPWYSDLFMGSLPNQQFGSVSMVNVNVASSPQRVKYTPENATQTLTATLYLGAGNDASYPGEAYAYTNSLARTLFVDGGGTGSFDVLALRKALALQKWKESNMRAGWKNRNQARAMFGVSTPEDRKHEIEFIKGYEFPVMIDEVINQSNTNLGELAGKGIGVGNGEIMKFNAGERHGYLYCIAYVEPMAEYDAKGIDKYLIRSEPFDHFVPAFENLGMEPISKFEMNALGNTSYFHTALGFAPRYHEYKTRVDKVYGEFMAGESLDSWVSVRRDVQSAINSGYIPTWMFYVNPQCLDSVFGFLADGTEATDQFMLNVNFRVKAVRPMSDLGLPNL